MKATCDLFEDHLDALGVLPVTLRHFGGRGAAHGEALTIKTFEANSKVKELANTPGEGRVLVVDGGGSTRRALLGDVIGAEPAAHWCFRKMARGRDEPRRGWAALRVSARPPR